MSSGFPFFLSPQSEDVPDLRRNWGWLLALGIALLVAGIVAIAYPAFTTLGTITIFGVLLVCGGAVEAASAIWARRWGGFVLHLLHGLLYLFVGIVILERPALGAVGYTLMLAVFFVAGGLVRIVLALSRHHSGWGWNVLSGIVTLALGLLIWRDFPESALWVIGTFVGIDLLFNGWSWVMLALAVRSIPPSGPGVTSYPQ
jgi:uncharacterized membrane protein HdeD (DUF308 family)